MGSRIFVFLALVACVAGNTKQENEVKRPPTAPLSPLATKYLLMYMRKSSEYARVPFRTSYEPGVLTDRMIYDNKTAIGALKNAKVYGLHDFRLGLRIALVRSGYRVTVRVLFPSLHGIGNVSVSRPAVHAKAMFSNQLVQVISVGFLNISADKLKVEKVQLFPYPGKTFLDVMTEQPIRSGLHDPVRQAYLQSAVVAFKQAVSDYMNLFNKILQAVPKKEALSGKPPVPLPRNPNGDIKTPSVLKSIRKIMAFWRNTIRKIHLDPLQVPIPINKDVNSTAIIRGLGQWPRLLYAGIHPKHQDHADLIMQYPVIGADLDTSITGRKLRLHANIRDLILNLQITNTDPLRVLDATDIGVNVPQVRDPRAHALQNILRHLKIFIARDLERFIVEKFRSA